MHADRGAQGKGMSEGYVKTYYRKSGPLQVERCFEPLPADDLRVRRCPPAIAGPSPEAVIRCLVALAEAAKEHGSGSFASGRSGV